MAQLAHPFVESKHPADGENIDGDQQGIEIQNFAVPVRVKFIGRPVPRFRPTYKRSSLPTSAVEWNASASIAELPVNAAAVYLQMTMPRVGSDRDERDSSGGLRGHLFPTAAFTQTDA
jgi:uncharacterized protein (DUF2236 family)